jgi:diguanylate cyclase (GGDEF)-like protein
LRDVQEAHDQLQDQIEEVSRLQEVVREQAIHDALTGLFNRRYLEETLPRELASARRHGRLLSIILLDVDRFKAINDSLGHAAGDSMLQQLAALLDEMTREGDIACRYGGDEFVLVLPDTSFAAAVQKAEAIRTKCRTRCQIVHSDGQPHITLSLGVAAFPDHGREGSQILVAADRALYRAKQQGRNQVQPGW